MVNSPEIEEQEMLTPKCVKRVYCSRINPQPLPESPEDSEPLIKLFCTMEYSNINRITDHDHLMDKHWHKWKGRMKRIFINCDITGYVTGDEEQPVEFSNPIVTMLLV